MMKNRSKKSKRSKIKKPKFVRLVQLWEEEAQHPSSETTSGVQNLAVEAEEDDDHPNMAYLFSGGDMSDASITTLLGSATITSSSTSDTHHTLLDDDDGGGARAELVRTALRKRNGGEEGEERWVFYSELVEKRSEQEVSSSCNFASSIVELKSLALKLDYSQIMDAWAHMGTIYTPHHNATYHHILPKDSTSNGLGDEGGVHNTCRVPEMDLNERTSNGSSSSSVKQDKEVVVNSWWWKMGGQREASVRRYKEKRQKRLYAKRIRYQVRKLNAEKRPRLKGRFVKRD